MDIMEYITYDSKSSGHIRQVDDAIARDQMGILNDLGVLRVQASHGILLKEVT